MLKNNLYKLGEVMDFKNYTFYTLDDNINSTKDKIEDLKNNNLLQYYIKKFEFFFDELNYEKEEGLPLVKVDKTILFTNSAIVSLKKYIKEGLDIPNYYITQPCVRVQNLDEDINDLPLYMSSFNMIGAFVSKEEYSKFILDVWNFLINHLDYDENEIKIHCNKNHKTLIEGWGEIDNGPEIIYSEEDYSWSFGEGDKMKGVGFDFSVKDRNGDYVDIGNIMEIISDGNIKGYALGLGVETLISKKNKYKNPVEYFSNKAGLEISENKDVHLFDTIKILIDTYRNGLKSGRNSSGYEIKRCFKKINTILGLSYEKYFDVLRTIELLEKSIFGDLKVAKTIYDELIDRSGIGIIKKTFTVLVDINEDEENLLIKFSNTFLDKKFSIKDIYTGNNIGENNKSITFKVEYVSKKGEEKNNFKSFINGLEGLYNIR